MNYGINAQLVWNPGFATKDLLANISEDEITTIRFDLQWSYVEPKAPIAGKHSYNWSDWDKRIGDLAAAGLTAQPIIWNSPLWAKRYPNSTFSSPSEEKIPDWLAFATALAKRYGPNGSFWVGKTYSARPISVWEYSNEPDVAYWWGTNTKTKKDWDSTANPAPAEYASIYKRTRAALRAIDPGAKLITAGLAGGPSSMGQGTWITRVLAANPGPVDGIGLHAYANTLSKVYAIVSNFRLAIDSRPEGKNLPIYITECGWPAKDDAKFNDMNLTPPIPYEESRAQSLNTLALDIERLPFKVIQIVPHTAVTRQQDDLNREDWFGIYNPDGTRKPSAVAYAAGIATATGPVPPPGRIVL